MTAFAATTALTAIALEAACDTKGCAAASASAEMHIALARRLCIPEGFAPPIQLGPSPIVEFRVVSMNRSYRSAALGEIRTCTSVILLMMLAWARAPR